MVSLLTVSSPLDLKLYIAGITSAPSTVSGCTLRVSNANNVNQQHLRQYMRLPKFLCVPLLTCHSLRTPQALHILAGFYGCFVLASGTLKPSPTSTGISKLYPTFRVYGYPYGLQDSLCTLRLACSQDFTRSATDATLDTGGWLNLTRQGLAPCKAHQASLGALTFLITGCTAGHKNERRFLTVRVY